MSEIVKLLQGFTKSKNIQKVPVHNLKKSADS